MNLHEPPVTQPERSFDWIEHAPPQRERADMLNPRELAKLRRGHAIVDGLRERGLLHGKDERGFALVIALGVCVVLAMLAVVVISSATTNERAAYNSRDRIAAGALADAGISLAVSSLRAGHAPDTDVSYVLDGNEGTYSVEFVSPGEYNVTAAGRVGTTVQKRTAHVVPGGVTWTGG